MPRKKQVVNPARGHFWRFVPRAGKKEIRIPTTVTRATEPVTLTLTLDHVLEAIGKRGIGDSQNCAMSCSAEAQAQNFPHPFAGYIDWTYTVCFVASKLDKNGVFPTECIRYEHNDDVARMFDNPAGRAKLIKSLKEDGPRLVRLLPAKDYTGHGKVSPGRSQHTDPPRPPKGGNPHGALLRKAIAF